MTRSVFRYELKKRWRDKTLLFNFLVIFVLSGLSLFHGNDWIEFRRSVLSDIEKARNIQYSTHIRDGEAYDVVHDTVGLDSPNSPFVIYWGLRAYAYASPNPVSILSVGQSDLYPYYSIFTGVNKQALLVEEEIQNPFNLFSGKADYLFFFVYILPLIIIAGTFDLRSSEAETGTYRLLISQGPSAGKIMLYKCLVHLATTGTMVLFSFITWLLIFEPAVFSGSYAAGLLLCMVLGFCYMLFWSVMAYFISSFGKNSAVNGICLMASWVILLFFIPSFLNTLAASMYPAPSRNEQALLEREMKTRADTSKNLLRSYLKDHPEHQRVHADTCGKVTVIDRYFSFLAAQVYVANQTAGYEETIRKALSAQQLFCDKYRFLSPALLLNHFVQHVTKTDLYHQLNYSKSLELFNTRWCTFIRNKIFRMEKFHNTDFSRLPAFYVYSLYPSLTPTDTIFTVLAFLVIVLVFVLLASLNYLHE